jgi:hypothetical protein
VGCISTVGFIPAVNGEAFSLIFRKYWHKKSERTKENAIVIDTTKFTTKNHKNHDKIMQNIVDANKQDYLPVLKSMNGFNLKEFTY